MQYILGEWGFRHATLEMCPPVFVPTAETEVRERGREEGREGGGREREKVSW